MFKKLKYVSLITLTIASILWSFNYVIGPVTSFHFSIIGFLLLLINYVWGLFPIKKIVCYVFTLFDTSFFEPFLTNRTDFKPHRQVIR